MHCNSFPKVQEGDIFMIWSCGCILDEPVHAATSKIFDLWVSAFGEGRRCEGKKLRAIVLSHTGRDGRDCGCVLPGS